jgi:hypothetical protein
MDSDVIEEEVEKNRRRFFMARASTGTATATTNMDSGAASGIRSRDKNAITFLYDGSWTSD